MVRVQALTCFAALLGLLMCAPPPAFGAPPLALERTVPLAGVSGRVDHLAIDAEGRRLFIAELGNGSVEAIDLATGRSLGHIGGLKEPQGLGYVPGRDELVVATGGDGMVRFYRAADLKLVGALKLGADADDVRVDPAGQVFVGYGAGALAEIDPATRVMTRKIPLTAHPEGFQVQGGRAYVNVPDADDIAVLDVMQGRELARWRNRGARFNFPMALSADAREIAVVYRLPAKLALFSASGGAVEQQFDTCGDADDVYFNQAQTRVYVICGGGAVDVFDRIRTGFAPAKSVPTRSGARTGLYSPRLDRLFVAAPARGSEPAAILVFRPR